MLREFFGHLLDCRCFLNFPGMAGLENCGALLTHLKSKRGVAEKCPVRHFVIAQQAFELKQSGDVYRLPGVGNPADGLTKIKSGLVSLLCLLESWSYNPGTLRPLRGAAFSEQ